METRSKRYCDIRSCIKQKAQKVEILIVFGEKIEGSISFPRNYEIIF